MICLDSVVFILLGVLWTSWVCGFMSVIIFVKSMGIVTSNISSPFSLYLLVFQTHISFEANLWFLDVLFFLIFHSLCNSVREISGGIFSHLLFLSSAVTSLLMSQSESFFICSFFIWFWGMIPHQNHSSFLKGVNWFDLWSAPGALLSAIPCSYWSSAAPMARSSVS